MLHVGNLLIAPLLLAVAALGDRIVMHQFFPQLVTASTAHV